MLSAKRVSSLQLEIRHVPRRQFLSFRDRESPRDFSTTLIFTGDRSEASGFSSQCLPICARNALQKGVTMTATVQWISLLFGTLALVQTGWALRCWECSSHTNVMCGDPMNTSDHQHTFRSTECSLSPYQSPKPICRKLVKREYGERIVVRSCSIPNVDEVDIVDGPCGPMHSSSPQTVIESCNICSTDLCNSAPSTSLPLQILYATVLALVAYRFAATKLTAL